MAFDDLDQAEQAESATAEASDAAAEPDSSRTIDESPPDSLSDDADRDSQPRDRSSDVRSSSESAAGTGDDPASVSEPAFGFEEAKQRPLYARQAAWDAFEDALAIDVEPTLRKHAVRDASKRELHDAALRVLADHADEVADEVLEARGIPSDGDDGASR